MASVNCNCKKEVKKDKDWRNTAQKMKFSIKDLETADLVTFTEEILNGKLYFLCSETYYSQFPL